MAPHLLDSRFAGRPWLVMGILNVTPDSFSDGGRYRQRDRAVAHALRMVAEGADLVDVGGESTRPGAEAVGIAEELDRVIPVIEKLRGETGALISVDTSKPEVMTAAVAAGAGLINDVRALRAPGALAAAAAAGVPVCLMHMKGEPGTMQVNPVYGDVVAEVLEFLGERIAACVTAGLPRESLILDPGFGFGKTLAHNLELLRHLDRFAATGLPVLAGLSRKSMIPRLTGGEAGATAGDRLAGSLALALEACRRGARIVRVHDVAPTVEALRVLAGVLGEGHPGHSGVN
jgi:dihydropteroate synthase